MTHRQDRAGSVWPRFVLFWRWHVLGSNACPGARQAFTIRRKPQDRFELTKLAAGVLPRPLMGADRPMPFVASKSRTFPDFSDCPTSTGTRLSVACGHHNGGPARGFSQIMPSFKDLLGR